MGVPANASPSRAFPSAPSTPVICPRWISRIRCRNSCSNCSPYKRPSDPCTNPASGTAAIQHADYSLVTSGNPAKPGEVIVVYVTGLGTVDGSVADGVPAPAAAAASSSCLILQAWIGGTPASGNAIYSNISYAGITPGSVGLYQLNIQVPSSIPSGNTSLYVDTSGCWFGGDGSLKSTISNVVTLPIG